MTIAASFAQSQYIAFDGNRRIASGDLESVAIAAKIVVDMSEKAQVLVFDQSTSRLIDVDYRGTAADVAARLAVSSGPASTSPPEPEDVAVEGERSSPYREAEVQRGRGRPKLGVVAREVTLLPRHWDWLATQPGGASAAVRRLVDEARRTHADRDRCREAQESAYRFMLALAGDVPGFEEATRALYAGDESRFTELTGRWPRDVRNHARVLAARAFACQQPATWRRADLAAPNADS